MGIKCLGEGREGEGGGREGEGVGGGGGGEGGRGGGREGGGEYGSLISLYRDTYTSIHYSVTYTWAAHLTIGCTLRQWDRGIQSEVSFIQVTPLGKQKTSHATVTFIFCNSSSFLHSGSRPGL